MVIVSFMPIPWPANSGGRRNYRMRDFRTTFVLSGVALLLVGGVAALASINPYVLLGLPPVLLAIAAIVRAIAGTNTSTEMSTTKHPSKKK